MTRVALIGPESTGKSTVGKTLARRFGYTYIPEYARTYVEQLGRPYTYSDVVAIALHQIEEEHANHSGIVLFDTEMIITKVWMQHVYGTVDSRVEHELRNHPMDVYLLFAPDIVAEPDPVRENLNLRQFFFDWYLSEIQATGRPYAIIRGFGEERIQAAHYAIIENE